MNIQHARLEDVWELRREVMYPGQSIDFVKLPGDEHGLHLGIYENKTLISVVSVFKSDNTMQFRKLATHKDWQKHGLATALLQEVERLAVQEKIEKFWCNARITAIGLYEKMGMKPTGKSWQKWGLDYIIMEKNLE